VFVDGWTIEAATKVADLTEDRALQLSEELARHSLIYLDTSAPGPRSRMLETIRVFVAERLAARADAAEIERKHASYYRALVEQADQPLRGAGQGEWLERLEAEAGNLAAAVRWHLAYDPALLPHMFRILWPFWYLRDHIREARGWVDELLLVSSLDPQARAELEWAAVVTAYEMGDDAATLAARQRLEPLLDSVADPFLRAACELVVAWTAPITGDVDGAVRSGTMSLEQFRAQDEPFWTAMAAAGVGGAETVAGRYGDALRHLREMRDIADRFGYAWLAAWSLALLGTVAIMQGQLDQAQELLDEALDLSVALRVSRNVALCLAAFARLALAEGDPERAALAAGAADGLRQRAGLRAWPIRGAGKPTWRPSFARSWAPRDSSRCSIRGPGSASGRRRPPSEASPRRRDSGGGQQPRGVEVLVRNVSVTGGLSIRCDNSKKRAAG
jgi:tetratricopeptide (TPR) repeat protein